MLLQLVQENAGTEQEHATVPVVVTGIDVFLSAHFIRLFNELCDAVDAFWQPVTCLVIAFDVAVAGFRAGGRDTEQDHATIFSCIGRQGEGALEGFMVFDDVIGRQHQKQLVAVIGKQLHRCNGNCRSSVAAERFKHEALSLKLACGQLLFDDEPVFLVTDQQGRLHAFEGQALDRLLKQCLLGRKGEELFGECLPRKRPESRTAAA